MQERDRPTPTSPQDEAPHSAEEFDHPRGTMAIVLLYALVFALSWLGLYLYQFFGRGVTQP